MLYILYFYFYMSDISNLEFFYFLRRLLVGPLDVRHQVVFSGAGVGAERAGEGLHSVVGPLVKIQPKLAVERFVTALEQLPNYNIVT